MAVLLLQPGARQRRDGVLLPHRRAPRAEHGGGANLPRARHCRVYHLRRLPHHPDQDGFPLVHVPRLAVRVRAQIAVPERVPLLVVRQGGGEKPRRVHPLHAGQPGYERYVYRDSLRQRSFRVQHHGRSHHESDLHRRRQLVLLGRCHDVRRVLGPLLRRIAAGAEEGSDSDEHRIVSSGHRRRDRGGGQ